MAPDFKTDDAHHEACDGDGCCRKDHVRVDERKRNPYSEGVDACGYRQKKDVCDGEVRGLCRGFFAAVVRGAPDHAEPEDAQDAAGDWCPDAFEPAFGELPEKIAEQGHSTLEYTERYRLEHGAAVFDARFAKSSAYGNGKAVHGFYNGDDDDFYERHAI